MTQHLWQAYFEGYRLWCSITGMQIQGQILTGRGKRKKKRLIITGTLDILETSQR